MKAILFCLALFLALASVHAIRLPTPYRPGVSITPTCYESYTLTAVTTFRFKWNTTKNPTLRANVNQWQLQVSDVASFGGYSYWWTDSLFPADTFTYDYDVGNSGIRCWGPLYIRVRAIAANGQTGPWSAVGTVKRGPLVPPRVTNITVTKSGSDRINIAAV